jgi:hypothetical protein
MAGPLTPDMDDTQGECEAGVARVSITAPDAESRAGKVPDGHTLGPDLRAHLGAQLRAMYHEIVSDPVPERFRRLLEELAKEGVRTDEQ